MSIKYDKLFALLEERQINPYKLKRDHILGQATYYAIKNGTGGLDYRSIDRLCKALKCQPGDLMEYIDDPIGEEQ